MTLQDRINTAIPLHPHVCRIKKAQITYEREKMLIAAMKQYNSGVEVIEVQIGKYKLQVNRSQIN